MLSYFRQQPTQANSWVGRAKSGYDETLRIAQRYHEQNEAVRLAKLCFEDPLHPIGRIGTPDEVAELIVWLCSNRASFLTGANISIDGGFVAQ